MASAARVRGNARMGHAAGGRRRHPWQSSLTSLPASSSSRPKPSTPTLPRLASLYCGPGKAGRRGRQAGSGHPRAAAQARQGRRRSRAVGAAPPAPRLGSLPRQTLRPGRPNHCQAPQGCMHASRPTLWNSRAHSASEPGWRCASSSSPAAAAATASGGGKASSSRRCRCRCRGPTAASPASAATPASAVAAAPAAGAAPCCAPLRLLRCSPSLRRRWPSMRRRSSCRPRSALLLAALTPSPPCISGRAGALGSGGERGGRLGPLPPPPLRCAAPRCWASCSSLNLTCSAPWP